MQISCGDGGGYVHSAVIVALVVAAALGLFVNSGLLCGVGALLACSSRHRRRGGGDAEALGRDHDAALAASSLRWASRCDWLAGMPVCCFNSRRRVAAVPGAPSPYALVGAVMAGVFELTASLHLTVTDVIAGL